jgi:hypothetical protein
VALSEVVKDVCSQVGFAPAKVDTRLLATSLLGFVALPPLSTREALAGLMQVYGFDILEVGENLVCIPYGQGPVVVVAEEDMAQEEGNDVFSARLRRLPPGDCPQSLALVFNEAAQYTLTTQRAQRNRGHPGESLALPLVLTPEEAAALVEKRLGRAAANPVEYSFSLPRAYAILTPGDRLEWQDHCLHIIKVAYGSPGLVQIQAVEESAEACPAFKKAGTLP